MPCRWRCSRSDEMVPSSTDSPDVKSWMKVRRTYLRGMRKQTRMVLMLMALLEALKIGPAELAYAGREGYPAAGKDDYGLTYTVACIISYIYVCAFMLVFVPLFAWWLPQSAPSDPDHPSIAMKVAEYLKKFNMISLPICALLSGAIYIGYLVEVFIYVDDQPIGSRKMPKNNKKNWGSRCLLLGAILMSLSLGFGAFQIWEMTGLAHVKTLEYAIIIVPIQINMGVMIGSKMQMKIEKRNARMRAAMKHVEEERALMVVDEKTGLIEV